MVLIAGLILLGILLLVLEILVLPGLIAGIVGGVLILTGIGMAYADFGQTVGNITFASSALLTFLAIYGSLKSKAWNRYGLKDTIEGRVNEISSLSIKEGDTGIAVSAIRPSGTVMIGNHRLEAQSTGAMIDAGSRVIVTRVLTNKVIVKAITD
jgi:membrane-bound ClpP family serine protease